MPPFKQHPIIRGGHLQTIASVLSLEKRSAGELLDASQHVVRLPDGDAVILHETLTKSDPSRSRPLALLLVHGLSGCHASPYMIRLAQKFHSQGAQVFRIDMRGCGVGFELSEQLTHAGRSDDLIQAIDAISVLAPSSELAVIAVSLGGNQILRALGRIGMGFDQPPTWYDRLTRVVAVSPPIDLLKCSNNMNRPLLRLYNHYFIRGLLSRIPKRVRAREDFRLAISQRYPRTLRELDDRFTAPLSGFENALDYYSQSSSIGLVEAIDVPTLVIASEDDPVVPVDCFSSPAQNWSPSTRLLVSKHGGHVGFIDRNRKCWLDDCLADFVLGPASERTCSC